MAPLRPTKRSAAAPRGSKPRAPTSYPSPKDTFSSTKVDKRNIKHSLLVSKIRSSASTDTNRIRKVGETNNKRRRPNKKLVASLESLGDALAELDPEDNSTSGIASSARISTSSMSKGRANQSLKSKPGVGKKRAKLEAMERERFGMNLALMNAGAASSEAVSKASDMAGGIAPQGTSGGFQNRWEALKRHVQTNMEKKSEFAAQG